MAAALASKRPSIKAMVVRRQEGEPLSREGHRCRMYHDSYHDSEQSRQ